MCGIAGIINSKLSLDDTVIRKMTDSMAHRGPDATGIWKDEGVILGHRRLSIIDLSEGANQPFLDVSGRYCMVFNGEVYNFETIKKELSDYPFETSSDTEVILAAYIKWGEKCVHRFNGMFALAIWDIEKKELFVARDRLGIKPFYYYFDGNQFLFASEMRALLQSGLVPKEVSTSGVIEYLSYQTVHAPNTIVKNIFQLLPGESGFLKDNQFKKSIYWNLATIPQQEQEDYGTVKKNVKRLILEAVERRMISDVSLGAFLSGGIDSSAIVALMAELSDNPINTFSVVFSEKEFDESVHSTLIAKKYNTKHSEILLKPKDFLNDLPTSLEALDSPSSDGVNTYVVSKATKNAGITVALSGLGGDELFMGYPLHTQWNKLNSQRNLWKLPQGLRSLTANGLSLLKENHKTARMSQLLKAKNFKFHEIFPILRRVMSDNEIYTLLGKKVDYTNVIAAQFEQYEKEIAQQPIYTQASIGDISSYTQNILLRDSDQMGMASSLEIRVPFFDHTLVEYVLGLSDSHKNPTYAKKLLVEALAPRLPDSIVHRKKMGFSFPWEFWIKNELREFCEDRINKLGQRDIFDRKILNEYWNRFLNGDKKITWVKIWLLVVLSEWLINNKF
jgi:asparagine synthase (glutamine-hydrolysing)